MSFLLDLDECFEYVSRSSELYWSLLLLWCHGFLYFEKVTQKYKVLLRWPMLLTAGAAMFVMYQLSEYYSYKEISWKEFFNDFLEPGLVSLLILRLFWFR